MEGENWNSIIIFDKKGRSFTLETGKKYSVFWGEGNLNNKPFEMRAIVDDHIVTKTYSRRKQLWRYEINHISWFQLLWEQKVLYKRRRRT